MILCKTSQQVSEVFQGELTYTTKCSKGHSINEETNPFWTLPLSLKDTDDTVNSVKSSFKTMFESKSFSGDDKVYCNECKKKRGAKTGCEMVKSPQILILLLKRFDFDYNTMSHVKSDCCVAVPCELQIKNKTYKLYGMVNHMGSLRGGHYTATILSNKDKTWYEFNDDRVNKVEEQPFSETGTYKSKVAYLLLYRASESKMSHETQTKDLTDNTLQKQDDTMCQKPVETSSEDLTDGVKSVREESGKDCGKPSNLLHSEDEKTQVCQKPVETSSEDLTDGVKSVREESGKDCGKPSNLLHSEDEKTQ
ncbi:ubiquitin carboxyl-terminal hydrolase 47-like, partial [Micropterus dolomieu]|uniref:ubiquitin carboxyl-terminal hydrolase 47-like n=1 Tax=Micropterus dolomieu TaxID=147949 RepID=UPI001E8D6E12